MKFSSSQMLENDSGKVADNLRRCNAERAARVREAVSAHAVEVFQPARIRGLRSVVLTGSLARDEATIVDRAGGLKLLGDADVLLVLETGAPALSAVEESALSHRIEEKLLEHGVHCAVHAHAVSPKYFRNLPRAIFSYELKQCGRTIWGEPDILGTIPDFCGADIPREDAWRMLCNRMIEHLAFVGALSNNSTELPPDLHYATLKLFLDMATSYLVFAGQYAPSYRERADRLRDMAKHPTENAPFPLNKFASRVSDCTRWKIGGDEDGFENGIELWQEAISYMRRLWRWEMIQLTNGLGVLTIAQLSRRLAEQQPASKRLRGWASLVKHRGWLKSAQQWPRWMRMAFRSTPRYLVYLAATEVAFRLPCLVKHSGQPPRLDVNWEDIRALLPEQAPQSQYDSDASWRRLIADVLWNYSQFLEGTTA